MSILESRCDACGRARRLPTAAVLLVTGSENRDDSLLAWFICSTCDDLVPMCVPVTSATTLITAGCHVLDAAGPPHPERHAGGPALGADDALALHELLADDATFDDARRGLEAAGS
jgi:hypothetical protein